MICGIFERKSENIKVYKGTTAEKIKLKGDNIMYIMRHRGKSFTSVIICRLLIFSRCHCKILAIFSFS